MKRVVGVRFKKIGKIYYFNPIQGVSLSQGQCVIVETARGIEYARVVLPDKEISEGDIVSPLKPILRVANAEDDAIHKKNLTDAREAMDICRAKIQMHKLDMKLLEGEYTFDRSKLIFYFTADGRVDFRNLVRDLASIFRTRIELRQIGVRDEAKKLGGYGPCGREYCCKRWLGDFQPVTIKMAKDQGLSLNPSKISGACGRLFCCLKYENSQYEGLIRRIPNEGSIVSTPKGKGKVIEKITLREKVKVLIQTSDDNVEFFEFSIDEIKVLKRGKQRNSFAEDSICEEELKTLED